MRNNNYIGAWPMFEFGNFAPRGEPMVNSTNCDALFAFHPTRANAAFCDGAVHFLAESTAANVINAMVTREAGDLVPTF